MESCSVVAFLVTALLIASGRFVELSAQGEVVTINRSGNGDIFRVSSSEGSCFNESCAGDFSTYLVEERECVSDTTLQRNCSVQLVPIIPNTFTTSSISSFIAGNGTLMVLDSVTNEYGVGRVHSNDGFRQGSGGGECRVGSLEVIRGRMQATQIDHKGFSIITSSMGITIRAAIDDLSNEWMDYDGEVFRMNIVCDANTNVDCVFFKLNGTADLTKEKFGGVFSANQTLSTGNYCLISTTQLSDTTFAATDSISTSGGILSANVHHFLTGAGCVIGVLLCLTVALSIVLCYKYVKKLNQSDINCGLNICNGNITIETKCARDKAEFFKDEEDIIAPVYEYSSGDLLVRPAPQRFQTKELPAALGEVLKNPTRDAITQENPVYGRRSMEVGEKIDEQDDHIYEDLDTFNITTNESK